MIIESILTYTFQTCFLYQFSASLLTFLMLRTSLLFRTRAKRYQLMRDLGIPGPDMNLLDGMYSRFQKVEFWPLLDLEYSRKYGNFFGYFIGDEPSIIITDLDLLKKLFFEETASFTERSKIFIDTTLSQSLLFAGHTRWKVMRKIISPAFARYTSRGGKSTEFIEDSIRLMLGYIDNKVLEAKSSNSKTVIDINHLMKSTAFHLISSMAIKLPDVDVRDDSDYIKNFDAFLSTADKGVVNYAIRFPIVRTILSFYARNFEYDKSLTLVKKTLNQLIDDGFEKLNNGTFDEKNAQVIDIMIKLHYERKLTRPEVLGNAEALLTAGYDTTSTTLTYIFWVIGSKMDVQDKLRDELMAHGIESEYLTKVINETMRIYVTVSAFTTRLATKTVRVGDKVIPQGCRIVHNNWLMSNHPDIWKDPEVFDPERFRSGADIHPCSFAPFGLSDRRCIGYQLALLEMKMVVCDILLRYKVKTLSPEKLEIVTYSIVLTKPKEKVMLQLDPLQN